MTAENFLRKFIKKTITKHQFWILLGFFLLSLLTRFYALEQTATFFWDQAYDLRQIQIFVEDKRITLIGPISEGGDKVYGSLTYYMLMPFALLGNFHIASTTYGAAFYGLVTAMLLVLLMYLINKKSWMGIALIASIWFPLIETSRWAWNPHLVLFWIVLGLIFFQKKSKIALLLSGIFLGLSIHHHYLSFLATSSFILFTLAYEWKNNQLKTYLWLPIGYGLAIAPFILFDLTHPPGLFITRLFLFNETQADKNIFTFLIDFISNLFATLSYYTTNKTIGFLLFVYVSALVCFDFKYKKKYLIYIAVWILQIFGVSLINESFSHYFLPGLVFFVIYLFLPRKLPKVSLVIVSTLFLLVGSVFTIIPQVNTLRYTNPAWQPNIKTVENITDILYSKITNEKLNGVNIAVLGSPDPNRYGWKYRSLLEIRGIKILGKTEYFTNNYLFVVSQASENNLRNDPSPEMNRFRNEKLIETQEINSSGWYLYLFSF